MSFVVDLSDLKNNSLLGNRCAIIIGSVTVKVGGLIPPEGSANGTRYAEIWPMDNAESSVQRHLELLDLFTRPENGNSNRRSGMTLAEYEKLRNFVTVLHTYMQQHNVFCKQFRTAVQQMQLDYPEGDVFQNSCIFKALMEETELIIVFSMEVSLDLLLRNPLWIKSLCLSSVLSVLG